MVVELTVTELLNLEENWEAWLRRFFKKYCYLPFSDHHKQFWAWVAGINPYQPQDSFIAVWPRGHGKSTNAEMACVYLGAKQSRNYVVYLSETQEQADKHVADIGAMLESEDLSKYYPLLCQRKVTMYGHSKGWKRNRLVCGTGFVVDALGLDSAARGIKFEGHRPDFIVFDDIDGKHDSVGITKKKIEILTHSILPAGASYLTVLGAQNLIHKNSIFTQLVDGRAEFLADRIVSGPHPALTNFTYKKRQDRLGYDIVAGEPTWEGAPVEKCQKYIDKFGLASFLLECQHDLTQSIEGALFPEFRETHHIITWSEFAETIPDAVEMDGDKRIPLKWMLGRGQDWGTTIGHPCVTVFAARPSAHYEEFIDCGFIYREIVSPTWPQQTVGQVEAVWPGKVARLIQDAQRKYNEESRMRLSVMSHEATAALNTYLHELPEKLFFTKWEPDARAGIAQIQEYLAIDHSKPHPFRKDPRTGQPLQGRPRLYFIVADGQGELYYDKDGKLKVRQAIDNKGLARLRWEIPKYRNRLDATGMEDDKPENKRDDDAVDALKGLLDKFLPKVASFSKQEKLEMQFGQSLQLQTVKEIADGEEKGQAWLSRQIHGKKFEQQAKPKTAFNWIKSRRRFI